MFGSQSVAEMSDVRLASFAELPDVRRVSVAEVPRWVLGPEELILAGQPRLASPDDRLAQRYNSRLPACSCPSRRRKGRQMSARTVRPLARPVRTEHHS
jgi:hypothetical protein